MPLKGQRGDERRKLEGQFVDALGQIFKERQPAPSVMETPAAGYVNMFRGFGDGKASGGSRFLSLTEAAAKLGCSPNIVASGITSGELDAARTVRQKGRKTLYLFDPERIERYSQRMAGALHLDVVCGRLGLDRKQVRQLARANLLTKVGLRAPYSYVADDVERLEEFVAGLALPASDGEWLASDRAAQLARIPLSGVISGVLAGHVAAARNPEGRHFLGLCVRPSDVYRLRSQRALDERGMTAAALIRKLATKWNLGYGKRSLERWANEGLIECTRTRNGTPRITVGAVEAFRRTYLSSAEVEKTLGITRICLYQMSAKGELAPVSRTGDSSSFRLYRRSDVDAIAQQPLVSLDEAALLLGKAPARLLNEARRAGQRYRQLPGPDGTVQHHLPRSYVEARLGSQSVASA